MENRIQDMTAGKPLPLLLRFALPLMLGNIFQQLYTVVDTAVVGKALGVSGLAALGASDWINWLVLSMIQGLTQGFGIMLAQSFGARQLDQLRRGAAASILLSAAGAAVLLVLGQLFVEPMLRLLQTPEDILPSSMLYLRIIFGGVPIVMAYNLSACILRSMGDSKTPLYAMVVASGINIGLDLLFVMVFHWGIAGAAAATLIAQLGSVGLCMLQIRKLSVLKMTLQDFKPEGHLLAYLLRLGSPMALQNAMISIGGMIVQTVINGFGVVFIAGITATNKMYGILELAAISYGYAMITYTGQNLGAGKTDRIASGVRTALGISLVTSGVIAALMIGFGRGLVGMFISGDPQEVVETTQIAYRYLVLMNLFLPILYILHVYRSSLQGIGNTVLPMVSGIAEFVMRTGSALLLPGLFGKQAIYSAEILAWFGACLVLVPSYYLVFRNIKRNQKSNL